MPMCGGNSFLHCLINIFLLQNLTDYDVADGWVYMDDDAAKTGTYRFVYKEITNALENNPAVKDDKNTLPALFTEITLPGEAFDNEDMEGLASVEINVKAYAIQAAGFNSPEAAWTALKAQNG